MDYEEVFQFEYNMNYQQRGMAIIINNRKFDSKTGMNERSGTDVDAAQLYQKFKMLEFNVQMHNNQTCGNMLRLVTEGKKQSYKVFSSCYQVLKAVKYQH